MTRPIVLPNRQSGFFHDNHETFTTLELVEPKSMPQAYFQGGLPGLHFKKIFPL